MATTEDFIIFICEQIDGIGAVRYKKMFGEYMVYVNEKPILLVCDNTVFVKELPQIANVMVNAKLGYPYKGAKKHYILDIEDRELAWQVIKILEPITSLPKQKKRKLDK